MNKITHWLTSTKTGTTPGKPEHVENIYKILPTIVTNLE